MAFRDPNDAAQRGAASNTPDLIGKVKEVYVDSSNPMLSSITVEAIPAENLGHYEGEYTLRMDDSKSVAQRMAFAEKAKQEGGGFCGALINEASTRLKGRKVHFENVAFTGEREATAGWVKSYRHDRLRRPCVIHTMEEPIRGQNNSRTDQKAAKVTSVSVINPEAFSLDDSDRLNTLAKHADASFKRATTRLDQMVDDQRVLRNSMPITEAMFAVLDNQTGEIREYSQMFSKKQPPTPNSDAYPEHYSDAERVNSFNGRPIKLPRDGSDFLRLADSFRDYVSQQYANQDVTPLCIQSTRLAASTKVFQDPDMYAPVDVPDGKHPTPLQQLHQANKTEFLTEPGNDKARSRGVLHPDVQIQFAPNVGSTYSKYVRVGCRHIPDENLNQPMIASCTYKGEPLKLSETLKYPVANAVPTGAALNAQMSAPVQGGQAPQQAAPAPQQAAPAPQQAAPAPQQAAPAPQQAAPAPQQAAPAPQQAAPAPQQAAPYDSAFDQNEALDQEAQAHNQAMREHEQQGGASTAPQGDTTPQAQSESKQPEPSSQASTAAPASAPASAPAPAPAPTPDTSDDMSTEEYAYEPQGFPFSDDDIPFS